MNRKKTVKINDPRIRKIRNNLRNLWIEFAKELRQKLEDREDEILEGIQDGDLMDINQRKQDLSIILEKSICKCYNCFRTDSDMTYNPTEKAWFCVDCYNDMRKYLKQSGDTFYFP